MAERLDGDQLVTKRARPNANHEVVARKRNVFARELASLGANDLETVALRSRGRLALEGQSGRDGPEPDMVAAGRRSAAAGMTWGEPVISLARARSRSAAAGTRTRR